MPRRRRMAGVAAILLAGCAAAPAGLAAEPAGPADRIVSLSSCVDQILLQVADPAQLASVTYQAADPGYSPVWRQARKVRLNRGTAEEVIRLKPDLVLADPFNARHTVRLLKRLGVRIETIPHATTVADIARNVRRIAAFAGRAEAGNAIVARMAVRLDALAPPPGAAHPVIAVVWSRGFSPGRGTVADTAIRRAGFRNDAAQHGIRGVQPLTLEALLTARIDAIAITGRGRNGASLAAQWLEHPALDALRARLPSVELPGNLVTCGTPAIVEAVAVLADLRRRMAAGTAKPAQHGPRR